MNSPTAATNALAAPNASPLLSRPCSLAHALSSLLRATFRLLLLLLCQRSSALLRQAGGEPGDSACCHRKRLRKAGNGYERRVRRQPVRKQRTSAGWAAARSAWALAIAARSGGRSRSCASATTVPASARASQTTKHASSTGSVSASSRCCCSCSSRFSRAVLHNSPR